MPTAVQAKDNDIIRGGHRCGGRCMTEAGDAAPVMCPFSVWNFLLGKEALEGGPDLHHQQLQRNCRWCNFSAFWRARKKLRACTAK